MPTNIKSKKLLFCFGTRPEAIKLAPLILEAKNYQFQPLVCLTGQHKELIEPINSFFNIHGDIHLNVMSSGQSLHSLTAKIITGMESTLKETQPDAVVVQGDTTSAMAGALAAFYCKIPVIHIEAGLRTEHMDNPFPEEMNRRLIGRIAHFHFAPTDLAKANLQKESITENVFVTGNTGIDALRISLDRPQIQNIQSVFPQIDFNKRILLTTVHRRENFDNLDQIFSALIEITNKAPDVEIVFPVHLNPTVRSKTSEWLKDNKKIHLLEPLNYELLIAVMSKCFLVLSDSGGLQEEAPYLRKPVLVLRTSTERQEGVLAGTSRIVGNSRDAIVEHTLKVLSNKEEHASFLKQMNPYGDGFATAKIYQALQKYL